MRFLAGLSKSAKKYLLLSVIALILGAVFFVFLGARFLITGSRNQMEGLEYGKGKEQQACVDEALRRHSPTLDPTMQLANAGFVGSCLIASKSTEGFCKDVPVFSILNQSPMIEWAETRCNEHGFTDGGCHQIFLQVISHCSMSKKE